MKLAGSAEKSSGAGVRDIAVLKDNERYIYNLVTKAKFNSKPTFAAMKSSLQELLRMMKKEGVDSVVMPRIGCGLDGLKWEVVKELLKEVFRGSEVTLVIYTFVPSRPERVWCSVHIGYKCAVTQWCCYNRF